MISQSKTFCPCPWTSLNITHSGEVLPCLSSYVHGLNLGNVHQKTIQEIIVGEQLQNLKQTIASGNWHDLCVNCKVMEEQTGASARTIMNVAPNIRQRIDQNIDHFELTDLTINWSNLCNLTCTYCNPQTSTAWQSVKHIPIVQAKNNYDDVMRLAKDNRQSIKGLSLGGGEPLLQKTLPDFLKEIDKQQTRVLVTTSLSVDLNKSAVYQELKTWPMVTWQISFDNTQPEKFEYVRNGALWSEFVENINILKSDGIKPTAHPAYSIYCAFDLVEYYEFCESYDLDIFWCELNHPYELDVKRLPKELRVLAQQEIDRVVDRWGHSKKWLSIDTLQGYQKRLDIEQNKLWMTTPANFHLTQEKILKQTHTFDELWPTLVF